MYVETYRPEGALFGSAENQGALSSVSGLRQAATEGRILEGIATLCDENLNLMVELGGGMRGIIPRDEVAYSATGEPVKDIAAITRVGKVVSFCVRSLAEDEHGGVVAVLSRRAAQEACMQNYLMHLTEGDVIDAKVTHMEQFGAFVDIGCGLVSLLSIDCISVSRISHPRDRFSVGDRIRVAVKSLDQRTGRIYVTAKELFGTWEENAGLFSVGQTVAGIVRSIEPYGIFVELTPNLAGLAEYRDDIVVGQVAAVYIKNIIPERMKIKLVFIDTYKGENAPRSAMGELPGGTARAAQHIDRWRYSPACCNRVVETVFA